MGSRALASDPTDLARSQAVNGGCDRVGEERNETTGRHGRDPSRPGSVSVSVGRLWCSSRSAQVRPVWALPRYYGTAYDLLHGPSSQC